MQSLNKCFTGAIKALPCCKATPSPSASPRELHKHDAQTLEASNNKQSPVKLEFPIDDLQVSMALSIDAHSKHKDIKILSANDRARTIACHNERLGRRCVIRVSPYEFKEEPSTSDLIEASASEISGIHQCPHRVLAFGKFISSQDKPIRGIVPFLVQPQILVDQNVVVELYEEIRYFGIGRMDLLKFVTSYSNGSLKSMQRGLMYLYDVLVGLAEMHRNGWAHLDVSLENIVVSMDRAYLIDFESVLPFETEDNFALRRGDLGVPMKLPFVPPEHMVSSENDLLSLPSYDVWAFGVCLFSVLFGEYLFEMSYTKSSRHLVMKSKQIKFFLKHGFKKFMRKYHPVKYNQINATQRRGRFVCESTLYTLGGDLLSKIFRRAERVPADEVQSSSSSDDDDEDEEENSAVYFDDRNRFDMQDVLEHPFWEVNRLAH